MTSGRSFFIVGTDTDVGKTFVTAGIASALTHIGQSVAVYKPVASGGSGDLDFISHVNGSSCDVFNTNTFVNPYSPHLAAEIEDDVIDPESIKLKYQALINGYDTVIVEGAGGLIVPLIRDEYYLYDMIEDLDIEVIVVARAGVGTINHTCLTVEALRARNISINGIVINGYNGSVAENDNIKVLKSVTGLSILAKVPRVEASLNDSNVFDLLGCHLVDVMPSDKL